MKHQLKKKIDYVVPVFHGKGLEDGTIAGLLETLKVNLTSNKLTNATSMFAGCTKLKEVDLSRINTNQLTTMYSMFNGCSTLKTIDISGFDITNIQEFNSAFRNCSNIFNITI